MAETLPIIDLAPLGEGEAGLRRVAATLCVAFWIEEVTIFDEANGM